MGPISHKLSIRDRLMTILLDPFSLSALWVQMKRLEVGCFILKRVMTKIWTHFVCMRGSSGVGPSFLGSSYR